MGTFLERGKNGSSRILPPGSEVKLPIEGDKGPVRGSATFTVAEDDLRHVFGVVSWRGPGIRVELGKDGVLPWEKQNGDPERPNNNVCAVRRQGVTIEHMPTGSKMEVVYVRDCT